METYVENNEENQINSVEKDKNPKEPPGRAAWKQKRKASSRVVKQELQLFPDTAALGNKLLGDPDDEA